MVALNDNFTEERDAGVRKQQSEKSADRSIPASRRSPLSSDSSVVQHQFLLVGRGRLTMERSVDAMNRRVRKTIFNGGLTGNVPDGTTDYIWSGWQVVEERNSSNAPIRQYVWGTYPGAAARTGASAPTGFRPQIWRFGSLNIDECVQLTTFVALGSQNLESGSYYLLQDLLYRAVALTNPSGNIVEAYDTDAYGNTLIFTGPGTDGVWFTDDDVQPNYGANEIIYCGYRYDPETELYYVRARTYSPSLGRWLRRDLIAYSGGGNLYPYVLDRPTAAHDPSGRVTLGQVQATLKYLGILSKRAKKGSEELERIDEAITVVKALRGIKEAREDVLSYALKKLRDAAEESLGHAGALASVELNADIEKIRVGVLIASSLALLSNKTDGCLQCQSTESASQPNGSTWSSGYQEQIYAGGYYHLSNYLGANAFWYSALITWIVPCKKDKNCNVFAMIAVPTDSGLSWVWVPCNAGG